jgi:DNA-3-methyladenine glycosylase II
MDRRAAIARDAATLAVADPRLASSAYPLVIEMHDPGFGGLVHLILGQQVSIEAADAMYGTLTSVVGTVTPEAVLSLDNETMRRCGFTRMKAGYARGLAEAVLDGLDLGVIDDMGAGDAIALLTSIRGIGVWTAECYLLFCAGRRDVFPAGDLALRVGWQEIAGMAGPPSEAELRAVAAAWAPRRSAAAHLIWDSYLRRRGRRH